jgi:hypothetical protein
VLAACDHAIGCLEGMSVTAATEAVVLQVKARTRRNDVAETAPWQEPFSDQELLPGKPRPRWRGAPADRDVTTMNAGLPSLHRHALADVAGLTANPTSKPPHAPPTRQCRVGILHALGLAQRLAPIVSRRDDRSAERSGVIAFGQRRLPSHHGSHGHPAIAGWRLRCCWQIWLRCCLRWTAQWCGVEDVQLCRRGQAPRCEGKQTDRCPQQDLWRGFVTVELVHDGNPVDRGTDVSHFVVQVESMADTLKVLADHGIEPVAPGQESDDSLRRRSSSTRTVAGSNSSSGPQATPTASPPPTGQRKGIEDG